MAKVELNGLRGHEMDVVDINEGNRSIYTKKEEDINEGNRP